MRLRKKLPKGSADRGRAVLADWDLQLLHDITDVDDDATCRRPGCTDTRHHWKPVVGIGQQSDRSAGIRGFWLDCAPTFDDEAAALRWAAEHEAEIRKELEE